MTYILELEPGVWLADWAGDPGKTLVKENAKTFKTRTDAANALKEAREFETFNDAKITKA